MRKHSIYKEPGLELFLIDLGDKVLSFHVDIDGPIKRKQLDHMRGVFSDVLLSLKDRGFPELLTYVVDQKQLRFAEFYGFVSTGRTRTVKYKDGRTLVYDELTFNLENI